MRECGKGQTDTHKQTPRRPLSQYISLGYAKCETHYYCCAVVQVSGTSYVELGSPIRLICNATGRHQAPDDISWYRGGVMIQSNPSAGVVVSKKTIVRRVLMSMLVIASSQLSDAGQYSCHTSSGDAASTDVHILNG